MHTHRGYTPTPMCLSLDAAPTQSCPSSICPIPWQVVETYECDRGTFVYSVTLLDRYLARKAVPLSELQLLGCACFLVATKTIGPAAFQMPLLAHVTDGTCDPSSIRVRSTRGTCIPPSLPLPMHPWFNACFRLTHARIRSTLSPAPASIYPRHAHAVVHSRRVWPQDCRSSLAHPHISCAHCLFGGGPRTGNGTGFAGDSWLGDRRDATIRVPRCFPSARQAREACTRRHLPHSSACRGFHSDVLYW